MSGIHLDGISKAFGAAVALRDVSLSIAFGELFCLFGPPGCGKTTLLRVMLGLETADRGEVSVGGRLLAGTPPGQRGFATVFQNLALFPHLTAYDNIAFPLRERRVGGVDVDRRVRAMAATLKLGHVLHKRPAQLSGGERQRVAIGRALVRSSDAVLMDEPISALDARLREVMRVELKAMQRESGLTVVYVTHDQEEALSVADRLCIMNAGAVEQIGRPEDIYNEPASRFVAEVMGSPRLNILDATRTAEGAIVLDGLDVRVTPAGGRWTSGRAPIEVGIRPESFRLVRHDADPVALPCQITHIEPLGGVTIVGGTVRGRALRVLAGDVASLRVGDEIGVSLTGEPVHVFDRADGRRLHGGRVAAPAAN